MLEIYNEKICDLLSADVHASGKQHMINASGKQHMIRHDVHGDAYVTNLRAVDVESSEEVSCLLQQAAQGRYGLLSNWLILVVCSALFFS